MNQFSSGEIEKRNVLRNMFAFFNAEKRDPQILAYGERLGQYELNTLKEACKMAIDGSKYLPPIADMLGYIQAVKSQNTAFDDGVDVNRRNYIPQEMSGKILKAMCEEYSKDGLERVNGKLSQMKPSCKCIYCFDSGLVFAKKHETINSFVFKCLCPVGKERIEIFPVWSKNLECEFKPRYLEA